MSRRIVPIMAEGEEDFAVVVARAHALRMPAGPSRESRADGRCPKCLCTVAASSAPERPARKRERPGGL